MTLWQDTAMGDGKPTLSVELKLPFLSVRAENVRIRLRRWQRSAGPFLLISRTSGLALDSTYDTAAGSRPHMWSVHGLQQQLWYLHPVGRAGRVSIVSAYSSLALDAGEGSGKGHRPQLHGLSRSEWQEWTLAPAPEGGAQIIRSCGNGLILDCPWDAKVETYPVIYNSNGGENQHWLVSLPIGRSRH